MKRSTTLFMAAAALSAAMLGESRAALDLQFRPPAIPAQPVCVAKRADEVLLKEWRAWDREALPKRPAMVVLDDARRLRDLDPTRNFEIVDAILDLVPSIDPKRSGQEIDVERIGLYLAAGKVRQLKQMGLVDRLTVSDKPLSPKALNTLAEVFLSGSLGVQDEKRGSEYLVSAAYGGNADALLRLAKMNLDGKVVEKWSVEPELAVLMAFGALVGKLDESICDRIGRIAREYEKGDIVKRDDGISEEWYRMAADLGDSNAAWKVAKLHLESEQIKKSNDTLVKYLSSASDGGVVSAKVELGRLYEDGALVPLDLERAAQHYRDAGSDSRSGLIRLSLMYERQARSPEQRERYVATLRQLAALSNAPGWIYSKLARAILADQGQWAGEAEALPLLERGVAQADADSAQLLAELLLRHRHEPGNFQRAVALLTRAVESDGRIDPMTALRDAYLCREPAGTNLELASYWDKSELSAANSSLIMKPADIQSLSEDGDTAMLATLQTQALYGRQKSVAYYLDYLQRVGADKGELAFWRERADDPMILAAIARLDYQRGDADLNLVLQQFGQLADAGLSEAAIDFAQIVLDKFPDVASRRQEAQDYLRKAGGSGLGAALWLLAKMGGDDAASRQAIHRDFAEVIDARGDAQAILFAASATAEPTAKAALLDRAVGIVPCDFDTSLQLAVAYAEMKDAAKVGTWLDISEFLSRDTAWRYVAVADRRLSLQGPQMAAKAAELYTAAVDLGEDSAVRRLLNIHSDAKSPLYEPAKAAKMLRTLLASAKAEDIDGLLKRARRAPREIRDVALADLSVMDLYRRPAEQGDPLAMRELAKLVREDKQTPQSAVEAARWFRKAANGGDAEAMVELAKAYALGVGVKPSLKQATNWLKLAAADGNPEAQTLLATMTP